MLWHYDCLTLEKTFAVRWGVKALHGSVTPPCAHIVTKSLPSGFFVKGKLL